MKRILVLLLSSLLILTLCIPVFAGDVQNEDNSSDPVLGSWILNLVLDIEGDEPVILNREEAASLYGSGISIFTFEDDGAGHEIIIDGIDMVDLDASWESNGQGGYTFCEKEGMELDFTYDENTDILIRNYKSDSAESQYNNIDFVYARAFIGSWTLDNVVSINEGDAPLDLPKEENASLYGSGKSIISFRGDGTSVECIEEGSDQVAVEGEWELSGPDAFTYTLDGTDISFNYFRLDDTIIRDYLDDSPDAQFPHLRFTYVRTETPEGIDLFPVPEENFEDELIAGGQIFSGNEMTLYDPRGGSAGDDHSIIVSELNQGGWADQNTGLIYFQSADDPNVFETEDGQIMVTADYFR